MNYVQNLNTLIYNNINAFFSILARSMRKDRAKTTPEKGREENGNDIQKENDALRYGKVHGEAC